MNRSQFFDIGDDKYHQEENSFSLQLTRFLFFFSNCISLKIFTQSKSTAPGEVLWLASWLCARRPRNETSQQAVETFLKKEQNYLILWFQSICSNLQKEYFLHIARCLAEGKTFAGC